MRANTTFATRAAPAMAAVQEIDLAEMKQVEGGMWVLVGLGIIALFALAADHAAGHPVLGGCLF